MSMQGRHPDLAEVLESAARLQQVVPDAVLVGGSAAAMHAGHRASYDHVLVDLAARYEAVLEAVEATEGWATSVRASRPPMTLMGSLGGIEAGLRQLRRSRPLETMTVTLPSGASLVAPTLEESFRVKAYLMVQRNQVRDYLDVVALAGELGQAGAVAVLSTLDDYYSDRSDEGESVLSDALTRLSEPAPRDDAVTRELPRYKGLAARWQRWDDVVRACQALADAFFEGGD